MSSEYERKIQSVEDVRALLDSPRASFEEYLDGVQVSRGSAEWLLAQTCAQRALESVGSRHVAQNLVQFAARSLATATLKDVGSVEELADDVRELQAALELLAQSLRGASRKAIQREIELVRDLLLLISDGEVASNISACSKLRRLERPDLGVVLAGRALAIEPRNDKALTTRGAALVDQAEYERAFEDLALANKLSPGPHVANAMSRLCLLTDRPPEAISWAREACARDPEGRAGLYALAKAAAVTEDHLLLTETVAEIRELEDDVQLTLFEESHQWVAVLAARELANAGQLELAEALCRRMLSEGAYAPAERELTLIRSRRDGPQR